MGARLPRWGRRPCSCLALLHWARALDPYRDRAPLAGAAGSGLSLGPGRALPHLCGLGEAASQRASHPPGAFPPTLPPPAALTAGPSSLAPQACRVTCSVLSGTECRVWLSHPFCRSAEGLVLLRLLEACCSSPGFAAVGVMQMSPRSPLLFAWPLAPLLPWYQSSPEDPPLSNFLLQPPVLSASQPPELIQQTNKSLLALMESWIPGSVGTSCHEIVTAAVLSV